MGDQFDQLARDAARELPRREAFKRIGGGLLGVFLAAVGLKADKPSRAETCGKLCAICCGNLDFPPRSEAYGQCIRDCHQGLGPCGPLVCPPDAV
jgi:hypothetical protein